MSLVPIGDPRTVGDGVVQYLGDRSHAHEGGHRIGVADREVVVQGDGRTTARNRSHVITRVLHALSNGDTLPVEALVGALILEGATSIEVDGRPISARGESVVASLRLDVVQYGPDGGEIRVTSIGGAG